MSRTSKEWSTEEVTLLKELIQSKKYGHKEMVSFFQGRTKSAIHTKCHCLGLTTDVDRRKYTYDEKYFSEYTLENCYLGGLLMADGHIKEHENLFVWKLAEGDLTLLENFKKAIKYTGPIHTSKNRSPHYPDRIFTQKSIRICNCKFVDDLTNKFGVTPEKTYRNIVQNFPTLEHELAFMVGIVDGDGCICATKDRRLNIQLTSCSLPTIEWFKKKIEYLEITFGLKQANREIFKSEDRNYYVYVIGGTGAAFLFECLNSVDVPKLDRKWKKPYTLEIVEELKQKYLARQSKKHAKSV